MQSLTWYARRLLAMSPAEILWRARCAARDAVDRYTYRSRTRRAQACILTNGRPLKTGFAAWRGGDITREQRACSSEANLNLIRRADAVFAGRLSFFDLVDHDMGAPIDWNRDVKCGRKAQLIFAPLVDYRDYASAGDCKFVWEPNRHHQLVLLGRAYRASSEKRYAAKVVELLESWLDQCPHGEGMNWRSALELGIRLINWVWTYDLISPAGVMTPEFHRRWLQSIYLHLWEIERNYSRGSSAANHLIGEAAGTFIAASYFTELPRAAEWAERARGYMQAAILEQTFPDGGGREQALGYHLFILQFFTLAGWVARETGRDFPEGYWTRLREMMQFMGALTEGGAELPMFGDNDDGYVLDLDDDPRDSRPWLAIGAVLFGDARLKAWAGRAHTAGRGLLGPDFAEKFEQLPQTDSARKLASHAWKETGLYLLQSGHPGDADRLSVTFDCGPLGFRSIAAHGHADALSFTLRAFGRDVLVDPGTYDYFAYPEWRKYFRSTRAHNTITVDDRDQSEMLGSFLWGRRAEAKCLEWQVRDTGGCVSGEQDGYAGLADPVIHRRKLDLDGEQRVLTIEDELVARERHEYAFHLHFSEHCRVTSVGEHEFQIAIGEESARLHVDPRLSVELRQGGTEPIGGWISRGYHRKTAATTLIGRCAGSGEIRLVTRMEIEPARASSAVESRREEQDAGEAASGAGVGCRASENVEGVEKW